MTPVSTFERALAFLRTEQQPDGSFLCLVTPQMDVFTDAKTVPAIVPTNIVLSSLGGCTHPTAQHIRHQAAAFLLSQRSDHWSLNYWFRGSEAAKKEPYPDDLDDTFCALAALFEYDRSLFDGDAMGKIATLLTAAEVDEGGPYDMWLLPPQARERWKKVDLVVNSNIAFFLSLCGVKLPKVEAFLEACIDAGDFAFPYNTIYPGIYFLSRVYRGSRCPSLVKLLCVQQDSEGKWENPLRTALALTALVNLSGYTHESVIEAARGYLIRTQQTDGSWPAASFYFQERLPEKTQYAGAASLTTALCVEALQRSDVTQKTDESITVVAARDTRQERLSLSAQKAVERRIARCDAALRWQGERLRARVQQGTAGAQIMGVAYATQQAIGERAAQLPDELLVRFAAANVCGWMAYTAFDDFLDGEGDTALMAPAQLYLRTSAEWFGDALPSSSEFSQWVKKVFDTMDEANAWEVAHTRARSGPVPDYGDLSILAHRSLGHALGPLGVLVACGYGIHSPEANGLRQFFHHALIARQLDDDLHDWQDDLQRGHVNAVAAQLARETGRSLETLFATPMEQLRENVWHSTLLHIGDQIDHHLQAARDALRNTSCVTAPRFLTAALDPIARSIHKARTERADVIAFSRSYG